MNPGLPLFTRTILVISFWIAAAPVSARVVMDGSMGMSGTISGPDYVILSDYGRQAGTNLFHSFEFFDIDQGETALFSGPASVRAVISRITGSDPSMINGTLSCDIPGAGLFLLNPNGLIFGPEAALDVDGSFYGSTGGFLRFEDGSALPCEPMAPVHLSSAPPSAFGFLDRPQGAIKINGHLSTPAGTTLSLAGGNIDISGGAYVDGGGILNLTSMAGKGDIRVDGKEILSAESFGTVTMQNDSYLVSDGPASGDISIRAGRLVMDNAVIETFNNDRDHDGGIHIHTDQSVIMTGGRINAATSGSGRGGDLDIKTRELVLDQGAQVVAGSYGEGESGRLTIDTVSLLMGGGSRIGAYTVDGGRCGRMAIRAGSIEMTDGSSMVSWTDNTNDGGDIIIDTGVLSLTGTAQIASVTQGSGNAGDIRISAAESINIAEKNEDNFKSGILTETGGPGSNGKIFISSPMLDIHDFGRVMSNRTSSGGAMQEIHLDTDCLVMSSDAAITGSAMSINADTIRIWDGAAIWGRPSFDFSEYRMDIRAATSLWIRGRDEEIEPWRAKTTPLYTGIHSDVFTATPGNAGDIHIESPAVTVDHSGNISARTYTDYRGGDITVDTQMLTLDSGGRIGVDSYGSSLYNGPAGNIRIDAGRSVTIRGSNWEVESGLSSTTRSDAAAGEIMVSTPDLAISDHGGIAVATGVFGEGDAGKIFLDLSRLTIESSGFISSTSAGSGAKGIIDIHAADQVEIHGGSILSLGLNDGAAGDIRIQTPLFYMAGGRISSETRGSKPGGSILLNALSISLEADARISSASSGWGDAGTMILTAGSSFLMADSCLETRADGSDGGDITIAAKNLFRLIRSRITTTVDGRDGDGGNIFIDPIFMILDNSRIIANAYEGSGGNIRLKSGYFFPDSGSLIQASSELGVDGSITIDTPDIDLGSSFVLLPEYRAMPVLTQNACAAGKADYTSSLIRTGRGGLPMDPYRSATQTPNSEPVPDQ